MGMSVPNFDGGLSLPFKSTPHVVCSKERWSYRWVPDEYTRCTRSTWVAGPDVDQADLHYQWGNIKRENESDFSSYERHDWQDRYVQVQMATQSEGPSKARGRNLTPVFTGVVEDDSSLYLGDGTAGDQTIKAFGPAHILDRWNLDYGHCLDNGSVLKLGYMPKFNEKGQWGRALAGNRSSIENPEAESSYDYVFLHSNKPDAEIWNAKQVLDYVLGFSPYIDVMPVVLTGQTDALGLIKAVWDPHGKTAMQFINEIINRKVGLGFSVEVNEGGGESGQDLIEIRVFTLTDEEVVIGDDVFPANENITTIAGSTEFPLWHLHEAVAVRTSGLHNYSHIEVRGARVKLCFSVSFGNQTLQEGWTTTLQDKYNAADGCTNPNDAQLADNVRETARFKDVYRKFIIPYDFDWQVGWGTAETDPNNTNDELSNIAPLTKPDGTVSFDEEDENDEERIHRFSSVYGKELFRDLPFLTGVDYTEVDNDGNPISENAPDANPEYRPMFAWVYDDQFGYSHGPAKTLINDADGETLNWYYRLDTLTKSFQGQTGVHDGHVRAVDREMALEVSAGKNHYLALGTFDPQTNKSMSNPDFDYTRIGATVFVESDAHLFVHKQFNEDNELNRTLVIEVPDCEYWYAHPSTTIDIKEGELVTIHDANCIIRDDGDKLRSIANIYFIWYGKVRRPVQFDVNRLVIDSQVGDFIDKLEWLDGQPEVNTVVTGVVWNFDHQSTSTETSYVQLDGMGMVEGVRPGKSWSGRGGAVGKGRGGKLGHGGRRR